MEKKSVVSTPLSASLGIGTSPLRGEARCRKKCFPREERFRGSGKWFNGGRRSDRQEDLRVMRNEDTGG